jgi:hypothetical protein
MADYTTSPNMGLSIPSVGTDPSPDWANNINASLTVIDQHNHSSGEGVQITPDGMNINVDLAFNDNNATELRSVRFQSQSLNLSGAQDLDCLYVVGVDLWYNDGNGNQVQISKNGGINATSSSISSGTATAGFVAGTLVVDQAANTPGNIEGGSILIGNNVANSKFVTLAPTGILSLNYQLSLPLLPAQQSFMTLDQFGNMAAPWTVDGTSIIISSNQLSVNPAGIVQINNNYQVYEFKLNGPYSVTVPSFPLTEIDGYGMFDFNATIIAVWIYNDVAGSAGTTQFDIKVGGSGGSFTSILSTVGSIDSTAAAGVWTDSNSAVGAQTGVVKPVVATTNINAGQAIRFDVLSAMTGANDCGAIVHFIPR